MDLNLDLYVKDHNGLEIIHYTFTDEDLLEWAKKYVNEQYSGTECESVVIDSIST